MQNQINSEDAEKSQRIVTSRRKPKVQLFVQFCEIYSDHERSTPYRSETHGIAERAVRRVKEKNFVSVGSVWTARNLVGRSNGYYCYVRNVRGFQAYGQTPYERRSNSPHDGPIILVRAGVELYPVLTKKPRSNAFGTKSPTLNI